jgi:putative glutamine amidotransferase
VLEPIERVMWELRLIEQCEKKRLPLLGVCYGMQLIALYFGGSLYGDIATDVSESIRHRLTTHEVVFAADFLGYRKGDSNTVASRHHQAVSTLPDVFTLAAIAPDGIIEAMQFRDIYGTQWHPESDETGLVIYQEFIRRCART